MIEVVSPLLPKEHLGKFRQICFLIAEMLYEDFEFIIRMQSDSILVASSKLLLNLDSYPSGLRSLHLAYR